MVVYNVHILHDIYCHTTAQNLAVHKRELSISAKAERPRDEVREMDSIFDCEGPGYGRKT